MTGVSNPKINNNLKHCKLYVDGMHCASCEVLVEKKLLQMNEIEAVDASLRDSTVNITYQGQDAPNLELINENFKNFGYIFSDRKFRKDYTPTISFKNGQLRLNKKKFHNLIKNFLISTLLVIAFFAFEKLKLGQYININADSSLPAFFILGIIAGLSSCAALVGGLLLSMIKQWNELYLGESDTKKAQPHILFHAGRILSFAFLGGILGILGDFVSFDNTIIYSILVALISFVMFILALQMLGVQWAQKIRFSAPKSFGKFIANEENFKGKYMPFVIGAGTFFLPCGFTLIAQGVALATGNFFNGSLIMLLFALGTFPALFAISTAGIKFNKKPHLTARFNYIAGLIIIFFVIYNLNGQLNVLGLPSLSDIKFQMSEPIEKSQNNDNSGIQVINFVAKGFSYIPQGSTTLEAGKRAKMIVDNQGIQGCGAFVAARGLIDGFVALKNGINEIDLGIVRPGSYKLTCSMGMVAPVTINVV